MKESRFLPILLLLLLLAACDDKERNVMERDTDPEKVPTMTSYNVNTIISDNGTTRFRVETKRWMVFEMSKSPHWVFPDGIKAQELDSTYRTVRTIECDSVYYDQVKKIWSLEGNVRIHNLLKQERIITDQMTYDETHKRFFSSAFIHLETPERVIEGYGYESDDKLAEYRLNSVKAIFPVDESKFTR